MSDVVTKVFTFIQTRWKTLIALVLVLIASKFDLLFVWGVFCFFWGIENIRLKEAYFVERIERSVNPILYWIIISIWFATGFIYFYIDEHIYTFINSL